MFLVAVALLLLFISIWSVIPAPVLLLFPFALGASELSPWLVAFGILLALFSLKNRVALLACVLSIGCCAVPWISLLSSKQSRAAAFQAALPKAAPLTDTRVRPIHIRRDVAY